LKKNVVVEFSTKPCGLPLNFNFQDLEEVIEDASFTVIGSIPTSTGNLTVELIGSFDTIGTSMTGTMSITGCGDPRNDTWEATKE
jgi:hypothetical protein